MSSVLLAPVRPSKGISGLTWVVVTWLGSRGLLAIVAAITSFTQQRTLDDVLGNWDVQHFLAIAQYGYPEGSNDIAFFPGWPLILWAISLIGLPPIATGSVLAVLLSLLAAAALHRISGTGAAIAWLLAPTAIFTMVPYTESLFCATAFWAWERARAGRWWQVALLTSIACAVRVSGIFLIGALVIFILTEKRAEQKTLFAAGYQLLARLRKLAWLLIPVGVVLAYATYLFTLRGSWTAWYSAQEDGWNRQLTWPWECFWNTIGAATPGTYPDRPDYEWIFRAEIVSMAVGVVTTIVYLWRKKLAEASWIGVQIVAFSTSYWFMSVPRATLLWFPLWTEVGRLERIRSTPGRLLVGAIVVAALIVQTLWALLFYNGLWAS